MRIFVRQIVHVMMLARQVLVDVTARVDPVTGRLERRLVSRRRRELRLRRRRQRDVGWRHRHGPFLGTRFGGGFGPNPRASFPSTRPKPNKHVIQHSSTFKLVAYKIILD